MRTTSRDRKTAGLIPRDRCLLLTASAADTTAGVRERAILAVFAYSAYRVGELVRLRVGDFRTSGEHRVLNINGKGGKERTVPLHLEAVERVVTLVTTTGITDDRPAPSFAPLNHPAAPAVMASAASR